MATLHAHPTGTLPVWRYTPDGCPPVVASTGWLAELLPPRSVAHLITRVWMEEPEPTEDGA